MGYIREKEQIGRFEDLSYAEFAIVPGGKAEPFRTGCGKAAVGFEMLVL